MDLDYLVQREAEERLRADAAGSPAARIAHLGMADIFRDRIDFRHRADFTAAAVDPVAPSTRH